MKKILTGLGLVIVLLRAFPLDAQIAGINDLTNWTGDGANQSVLIVQWNDAKSPAALTWGFHWDSGQALLVNDMAQSILRANVGLFARGDSSSGYGSAFYGFGYSANTAQGLAISGAQDGSGTSTTVSFSQGFADMNLDPAATEAPWSSASAGPTNPSDRYQEGWNDNGYWELFSAAGTAYPSVWTSSLLGANEPLVNNGWFAFSITDSSYNSNIPGPAIGATPEPATGWLVLFAGLLLFYARKRFHAR